MLIVLAVANSAALVLFAVVVYSSAPDALVLLAAFGVGATALFDLWGLFLNKAFGIPLANWAMVGRWFLFASIRRPSVSLS